MAPSEEQLQKAISDFVIHFDLVFDNDWDMTKSRILEGDFINENGTFINPNIEDEDNNWGNRGSLLDSYRRLIKVLKERNIPTSIDEANLP